MVNWADLCSLFSVRCDQSNMSTAEIMALSGGLALSVAVLCFLGLILCIATMEE